MLKKAQLTYKGLNQDISNSKRDPGFYYDAGNIRILATDSNTTGSISNDKGTTLLFDIASGYTIIGHATLKDYVVLFCTNNSNDIIYRVNLDDNTPLILFTGDLNFSTDHYIETEINYESEDVQKVYWVDGVNQLRHMNIISDSLPYTQTQAKLFDAVPEVSFSAIELVSEDYGGTHTSGMIQYGYNLVNQGGSQSALSPLTQLYPLSKQNKGGLVNEVVGKVLNLKITGIDTTYDIIKLYSIKYSGYNQTPVISLIAEESISGSEFTYSDDGRVITTLTASELLFLGSTPIIPEALVSKYNRLILGNIKESYFDVDTADYDTRAYRFPISSTSTRIKNKDDIGYTTIAYNAALAATHDCINPFDDLYLYKNNSTIYGATGPNITIEVNQVTLANPRNVLKSNESYRFAIEFFNKFGQTTSPKWIADLYIPDGNLNGSHNTLKVTLSNTSALTTAGVVGWRVLRVERTEQDKTILCQGIVNPTVFQNYKAGEREYANATVAKGTIYADQGWLKIPSPFMRNTSDLAISSEVSSGPKINKILHGNPISIPQVPSDTSEWPRPEIMKQRYASSLQNTYVESRLFQMYSPEVTFMSPALSESLKYKVVAKLENAITNTGVWCKQYTTEDSYENESISGELSNEVRSDGYVSLFAFAKARGVVGASEPNQNGILGPAGGDTKRMNNYHYWRKYVVGSGFTSTNTKRDISGTIKIIGKGESSSQYESSTITNISSKYKFSNHIYSMVTDNNPGDKDRVDDPIISINSIGATCINIIDSSETKLESILSGYGVSGTNVTGLIEIYRTLDNQYGGNTYEARSRNTYMRIGSYMQISSLVAQIDEAGDTFVGQYSFERIIPNTTQILDYKYLSLCEIVEFPVETSIDMQNRSDWSNEGWDAHFQPTFEEYHNYNRVYSQQPIFNTTTATPFTFVERKVFENRLLATKVKISGELVDGWTDIQINEELYVDGNYGGIVKLIKNNDLVACFQDNAVSALLIQPRVQTVGTDGTSIELGRGTILYDFKYITTTSGGTNKQCIFRSPSSIYYLDVVNRSINRISSEGIQGISDVHGLHSLLYNTVNETHKGLNYIIGCFDQITNDAYFTMPNLTIAFNEQTNSFVGKYSFVPYRYISTYKGLLSCKPTSATANVINYGALYNFFATQDTRKISSSDSFIVPDNMLWSDLFTYVGSGDYLIAGGKLKETGLSFWDDPNIGATNEFGFNSKGSGFRTIDGSFYGFHIETNYQSKTDYFYVYIQNNEEWAMLDNLTDSPIPGLSIRLCNPTTSNANGHVGSYTQNDGTVIPTIVINGIEWTMNLNETQFRNGDWIHGYDNGVYTPISNEDWSLLATGAMCYYNDDESNGLTESTVQVLSDKVSVWQHNTGEYGDYYGVKYDSYITLLVAPEPDVDCVLNNVEFKSEVYDNGVDVPLVTMSKIRAWNNYQDSNTQTLTVGQNIKRKYRDWNLFVPRVYGKPLQRIRNPWNFLRLDFDNTNNYRLVLHDIIASYEAIYKR